MSEAIDTHSLPPFARRIQRESDQHSVSCSEQVLSGEKRKSQKEEIKRSKVALEKLAEFVECSIPFKYDRLRSSNAEALFVVREDLPPSSAPPSATEATADTMEELESKKS